MKSLIHNYKHIRQKNPPFNTHCSLIKRIMTAVCINMAFIQPNLAYAIDKIYSPNIEKGELEIEYIGNSSFDAPQEENAATNHALEIEYGLTDRFLLELEGEIENEESEPTKFEALEFAGRYQITKRDYLIQSAFQVGYEYKPHEGDADEVVSKLYLESRTGQFLHRTNFIAAQEVGEDDEGGPELSWLWSSRYRYNKHFQPGFEIQSNFGKTNEPLGFNEQEHFVGPSLYGAIGYGFNYEAAYLLGVSDAAADQAVRWVLEYEIEL